MNARTLGRIAAALFLSLPVGATAQRLGTIEVAGFGRYTAISKDRAIDNTIGVGGGLGLFLSNRIKLTADAAFAPAESDRYNNPYFLPVHVRVAYEQPLGSDLRAILGGGWVYNRYSSRNVDNGLGGVLGLRYALNETLGLYAQYARDWMPDGMNNKVYIWTPSQPPGATVIWNDDIHNSVEAGLSARFGPRPRALIAQVEPVPTRTDAVQSAQFQQQQAQQQQTPPPVTQTPTTLEKAAEPTEPERFVTLEPVYFDFDRWELRADVQQQLVRVAAILRANPDATVVIEGHTDPLGPDAYNLALGTRRAEAVQRFLLGQNVDAGRLQIRSYGKQQLADAAGNDAANARNRRVEFRLPVDTRLREPR